MDLTMRTIWASVTATIVFPHELVLKFTELLEADHRRGSCVRDHEGYVKRIRVDGCKEVYENGSIMRINQATVTAEPCLPIIRHQTSPGLER